MLGDNGFRVDTRNRSHVVCLVMSMTERQLIGSYGGNVRWGKRDEATGKKRWPRCVPGNQSLRQLA